MGEILRVRRPYCLKHGGLVIHSEPMGWPVLGLTGPTPQALPDEASPQGWPMHWRWSHARHRVADRVGWPQTAWRQQRRQAA